VQTKTGRIILEKLNSIDSSIRDNETVIKHKKILEQILDGTYTYKPKD